MAYYDLREYLEKLEKSGEYRNYDGPVDMKYEAGAIIQRTAEKGGPAIRFSGISNNIPGCSFVGGLTNRGARFLWSKVAQALELDPLIGYHDLLDEVVRRLDSTVKPMQVKSGPCKENILRGKEIDLAGLSAPWIHDQDDAPCLSSWGFVVVQEPRSNYLVWEVVPHRVKSASELVAAIRPDTPLGKVWARHLAAGTSMPFAIVLGGTPVATMAAAFKRRRDSTPPADVAGGLQRGPMQMVKCEESSLLVPATAEMIIEGVVRPGNTAETGAFPGSFGYVTERTQEALVWDVNVVTHRNEPVLPFSTWGVPVSDIHLATSLDCDAQLRQEFNRRGTPVRGVYTPPWLAGTAVVVGTKVAYTAFSQVIAGVVRTLEATKYIPYVIVCDDDIDVTNPVSVFHAMVTKCRPGRDTWQIHNTIGSADAPYLDAESRASRRGSALILDCTWPLDWDRSIAVPPRVSFDQCYPVDLQEKILADWSVGLGFPKESERPAVSV